MEQLIPFPLQQQSDLFDPKGPSDSPEDERTIRRLERQREKLLEAVNSLEALNASLRRGCGGVHLSLVSDGSSDLSIAQSSM